MDGSDSEDEFLAKEFLPKLQLEDVSVEQVSWQRTQIREVNLSRKSRAWGSGNFGLPDSTNALEHGMGQHLVGL